LLVPLRGGPDLVGFVLLMEPRTRFDLNWEVYDLLKAAGCQAAAFLAHVMAAEALLEARKFDAFNRMSAFVVHDLKNIVAQLSLMMKNAKRLQGNVEFQQDMLMTVENSLEKMRQLMVQLREGVSASDGAAGVNLEQILRHAQQMAAAQGRELAVRARQPLRARGSAQRLERVIGHWIQNAIDATVAGQDLWVELVRMGSYAKLVVGDGGKGMTAEFVRDELFRPFSSTKGNGMGIGAYECQQYLQELGGKISVQSTVGSGTRVEMLLPLLDLPTESDLDILKAAP
jgi:putative PEP-CTERM system histidine kinase